MGTRVIPAAEFQANCLQFLDEVAETGDDILVTSKGRAVAHVVPPLGYVAPAERLLTADELLGSAHWIDDEDLIEPTGEPWPGEGRTPPSRIDLTNSIVYEGDIVSSMWNPLTMDTPDYRI